MSETPTSAAANPALSADPDVADPPGRFSQVANAALALAAVLSLAIAQPLFDLLGSEATFFVAHESGPGDIVRFALVVFLAPILIGLALVGLAWAIKPALGRGVLAGLVGLAGAVALLQLLPESVLPNTVVYLLVGVALLVGITLLFHRAEPFRLFLQTIGWISPAVLALFLFGSGASDIVFAGDVAAVGEGAATDDDVVMVVFDEFSLAALLDDDLEIDAERFPNFARLAATSTWYDDTTTVSPRTQWAVPSILTGNRPDRGAIPIAALHSQNLFTVLAPSHGVDADEIVTRLCPTSICAATEAVADPPSLYKDAAIAYGHSALPTGLAQRWLPAITDRWAGFGDDDAASTDDEPAPGTTVAPDGTIDPSEADADDVEFDWLLSDLGRDHLGRWNNFIAALGTVDAPTVSYHHSLFPHAPYTYLGDGRVYNGQLLDGLDTKIDAWESDQGIVDTAIRRYHQQARLADVWVGQLLDALEASGRLDDALVVITADHGTALTAGQSRREPQANNLADVASVPLFVKYPGQTEPVRDDRQAQTIDVFPTIADVMGVTLSDEVDGRSLRGDWTDAERTILSWPEGEDFEANLDLAAAVGRLTSVVPAGSDVGGTFSSLDGENYGGRAISSFTVGEAVDASVIPDRADLLADVDPSGAFVPSRFVATVDGLASGTDVLFALNGTVAAAATTGSWQDRIQVAALLDPAAMVEGANSIEAYVLDGGELRPIEVLDTVPYDLVLDGDGRVTEVQLDGETWTGGADGYLGFANNDADPALLQGWVADVDADGVPDTLLLVSNGEVLSTGFRRIDRPAVAEQHGEGTLSSGFQLALSPALADRIDELTVVALFADGGFLEIP